MTKEELRQKLRKDYHLLQQFKFEVLEREAIIAEKEGEFQNTMQLANELTVEAWLKKL